MNTDIPLTITYNKKQIFLPLFGSMLMVVFSLQFLTNSDLDHFTLFNIPYLLEGICVLWMSFFGYVTFIYYKKMKDQSPALAITNEGIIDKSKVVGSYLINWNSIEELRITKIKKQEFLSIMVQNPESFIQAEPKRLERYLLKRRFKKFGTPFAIASTSVETNLTALKNVLEERKALA